MYVYSTLNSPLTSLVNYWPFSGSTKDIIGNMDMTIELNGQLSTDQYNNANGALKLNIGYSSIPSGNYFDPTKGCTIMGWIFLTAYPSATSRFCKLLF